MAERYDPRSWGRQAIQFGLENARVALWATPGVGKTGITYATVLLLKRQKLIKGVLVVAPLNVVYNVWPAERLKWEQFKDLTIRILHGKGKFDSLCDGADVYVINYEGLPALAKHMNDNGLWRPDRKPFDMLVLDEASKVKNPGSQRFKLLKGPNGMAPRFRRILELTGTPAPNGLKDVWSQIHLLDEGVSLGRYKTHFYDRYFHQVGFGGFELILKEGADQEIYDSIKHLVLRMDGKDFLDMPEMVVNDIKVPLEPDVMKKYKKLENDLVLHLENAKVSPTNAAAAVNKALQFTGGAVYDDDGVQVHEVHNAKLDALDDLLDELGGQPLLVGYNFRHEGNRFEDRYRGSEYAVIRGGMDAGEVKRILQRWEKGSLRALFAQIQVVSHGLNLQSGGACNLLFYGLPWDLEGYEQFIARLYRQGQKNNVFVHRFICPGTVDVQVAHALKSKDLTQQKLLEAMKNERSN